MGGAILVSLIVSFYTPQVCDILPQYVGKLYGMSLFPYLWMFLMAAFVAEYKNRVLPFFIKYWWFFIILLIIKVECLHWDLALSFYPLVNTVLRFCGFVGFAYAFPRITVKTDISYGIYIYHMTIVNALIALGCVGRGWTLWVVLFGSCLLAWISTKTIGALSLRKKS